MHQYRLPEVTRSQVVRNLGGRSWPAVQLPDCLGNQSFIKRTQASCSIMTLQGSLASRPIWKMGSESCLAVSITRQHETGFLANWEAARWVMICCLASWLIRKPGCFPVLWGSMKAMLFQWNYDFQGNREVGLLIMICLLTPWLIRKPGYVAETLRSVKPAS